MTDKMQAYISVIQENHKATVTTSKITADQVLDQLRRSGFSAIQIPLQGRFHWQGHLNSLAAATALCHSNADFRFKNCSGPSSSSIENGLHTDTNRLHHKIMRSILVEQSNWCEVFNRLQGPANETQVELYGLERHIPNHTAYNIQPKISQIHEPHAQCNETTHNSNVSDSSEPQSNSEMSKRHIAVIGMACHLPGAADMNEFWDLLCSAKSQHVEVPIGRVDFATPWRQSDQRRWYGNFVDNHDSFDRRFFKMSPREAASTDPQQRLMLQVAYQAVEQAGYLNTSHERNIGCYIAYGSGDYAENVACHPANAYAATGNLKAFAAGRISHYFGWTGPGLTIDSACSSSALAIHLACQGILSGDCKAALVGGVNIISGPEWYYNLSGASFLSPTGQCKPFDAAADGYCRGEAVGAVLLKEVSAALEDGDQIFGIIAGSAVQQNQNNTAITVPNEPSLSEIFRTVTKRAGMAPADVTYVEAHGTGTAVGDPAEYDSIRRVFGGSARSEGNRLSIGSVKGLLGHAESASGMVALLKLVAMMHHGVIPPQASFQRLNPALRASLKDNMDICTTLKPWSATFKVALINNYGASGSNSSLLLLQPPEAVPNQCSSAPTAVTERKGRYPFRFYASDECALRRYTSKLLEFTESDKSPDLADMSFQVARQSNTAMRCLLSFSCETIHQLRERLGQWPSSEVTVTPPKRPIILCFGGQKSTSVGLDEQVYHTTKILRTHLDRCNAICESLGTSIYPSIFQKTPIHDTIKLHASLFSIQYACGQSWIDCMSDQKPEAVVGHSFGELSALCVSGAVDVEDMMKYVVRRARLIRDAWGPEKGSMLTVEAGQTEVESLLAESALLCPHEPAASIACFNGPNSFTIAGSIRAIDGVVQLAAAASMSPKVKRLDVANAYHCSLAESIIPDIKELALGIKFHKPRIHVESTIENGLERRLDGDSLINHIRQPVFFSHAVQRLCKAYRKAIWVEAGSKSGVTMMASRAIERVSGIDLSDSHFQPLNITDPPSSQGLADATIALWRAGLSVSFWPHHRSQMGEYSRLILPPYQFDKDRYWVERNIPKSPEISASEHSVNQNALWSFVSFQDIQKRSIRFRVNTDSERFQNILESHLIAQAHPLCPSILQLDIAIDALMSLQPSFADGTYQPQLLGMESHIPMPLDCTRTAWLDANTTDADGLVWSWTISTTWMGDTSDQKATTTHVTGRIAFRSPSDYETVNEFRKLDRLVRRERCLNLLDDPGVDDLIQGQRNIYRAFSDVVKYGEMFRGLHKIAGKNGNESAGRVTRISPEQSWLDFVMADCFCQVAGIFINSMTDRLEDEVYISDRIEQYVRSPYCPPGRQRPELFEVYACHDRPSTKEFLSDVFVFDPTDGALLEVIIGIRYRRIPKIALSKMIQASEAAGLTLAPIETKVPTHVRVRTVNDADSLAMKMELEALQGSQCQGVVPHQNRTDSTAPLSKADISFQLKGIIASLSGLESSSIEENSQLIELGIDSLMGMELSREIENAFKCRARATLAMDLVDFRSLVNWTADAIKGSERIESLNTKRPDPHTKGQENGTPPVRNGDHIIQDGTTILLDGEDEAQTTDIIIQAFRNCNLASETYIRDNGLAGYVDKVLPKSDALCISFICDAFEQLGCPIRSAVPGQKLTRFNYLPRHEQFVRLLYESLESRAGLIKRNESGEVVRTAVPAPTSASQSLLEALSHQAPAHIHDHDLVALAGTRLADCLVGKADCTQLMFGSSDTRDTVSAMYSQSPINTVWIRQMEDVVKNVVLGLSKTQSSINILELGSGTGGTTSRMVSLLATLQTGTRVTYTVTDISSSLVMAAKKRFKGYPFVNCLVHDIEEEPASDQLRKYDVVLATNCVHATRSLLKSTKNIHQMLRPNGLLLMLEMTEPLLWVDLVFGLVEGWWLFDDGRQHALACPELWEKTLHDANFGLVSWTNGKSPESRIQKLIMALANGSSNNPDKSPSAAWLHETTLGETDALVLSRRQQAVDHFVQLYSSDFSLIPNPDLGISEISPDGVRRPVVLVTGTTGSLGSHLLQDLSSMSNIGMVVCLNRTSSVEARSRQESALNSKGITVETWANAKWRIFQTDTHRYRLGLSPKDYRSLTQNVTHIVHNAWPMSIRRPIRDFESQFKVMRNLIDLARDAHACQGTKIGFQFISSIAVVGLHPLRTGHPSVPEQPVSVDSVLPNGYGEAKLVCEIMLAQTLQKFPDAFSPAMTVRIGQIAGSRATGYWNPVEHFAFMMKSSETVGCLPDLRGSLSWCPVDEVAETLGELLLAPMEKHPIYHIENPVRQDWEPMIRWLSTALNVDHIVPYPEWLARVCHRESSLTAEQQAANPAARLADFLEKHFERMSCGGLVLGTERSRAGSSRLRIVGPVDEALLRRFVKCWQDTGLLRSRDILEGTPY